MNPIETLSQKQSILEKQKKYLWPNALTYYAEPLPLERGEGMYVWDCEGKKYLDFFAGILTTSVGHNNPTVNNHIKNQVDKLLHTSTLYPNAVHVNLAESLAEITPKGLDTFYLGNSGTDANESAILLAQIHTGNTEVIALRHGYSGKSLMGMSLTGQSVWRMGPVQAGFIRHAMTPYAYRSLGGVDEDTCVQMCLDDLKDVIQTMTTGKIAALILEPIQGVGGFITLPAAYIEGAVDIARTHGGLIIIDEIQTGFGRAGKHWWAHQHANVTPDILTIGKGIANGMPLAATVTTTEIAASAVGKGLTLSTFGGNPVACAASLGTLEELKATYGPARSQEMGTALRHGLEKLQAKYPIIGDVRGKGLMQALELVSDLKTKEPAPELAAGILQACREEGLLVGKGGMHSNCIRVGPPLIANHDHIAEALEKLELAFKNVCQ